MNDHFRVTINASGPFSSAIAGGVGAFFAPAAAASCGGALNVMGACAVGSLVALPVSAMGAILAGLCYTSGCKLQNPILQLLGGCIGIASVVGNMALTAKIGAAITGLSFMPVFTSLLLGSAILALSVLSLTISGMLCQSACKTEPSKPRFILT